MIALQEHKELREVFGHDERAINRHSQRYYSVEGTDEWFYIDKVLDACPPCYELLELKHNPLKNPEIAPYFPKTIEFTPGFRFFGDGVSWKEAEKLATEKVNQLFEEYDVG